MVANRMRLASWTVLLPTIVMNSAAFAQDGSNGLRPVAGRPTLYRVAEHSASPTPIEPTANPQGGYGYVPAQQEGYVQLNAPLYPSPQPHTPIWTGGSFITNQALAPHEMLYPHTYKAMYPPYYHKVHGKWFWTPFGMRSHEHWKLQGTMVEVKYRSHHPVWPSFHPPRVSHWGGPWQ